MFFTISSTADNNFQNHYSLHQWTVSVDDGWNSVETERGTVLFKGYVDSILSLEEIVRTYNWDIPSYLDGNFTLIKVTKESVVLRHSKLRPYPLWSNGSAVSNLQSIGDKLWVDDVVDIVNSGVVTVKTDISTFKDQLLDTNTVINEVCKLLQSKIDTLAATNRFPLKVFKSGGLDTALIHAMISSSNLQFENVVDQHWDDTVFTQQNSNAISNFWAYKQLHHWRNSTMLATGSHGDEFFLRGPEAIAMLTAWHNIDFLQLLDNCPNAYHYTYFLKEKNLKIFKKHFEARQQIRDHYPTLADLKLHIIDMLANDHQHWHLEKTLTWTPFMDLRIPMLMLSLPINSLLSQFLNGTLTRRCIEYFDSSALLGITKFKNQ